MSIIDDLNRIKKEEKIRRKDAAEKKRIKEIKAREKAKQYSLKMANNDLDKNLTKLKGYVKKYPHGKKHSLSFYNKCKVYVKETQRLFQEKGLAVIFTTKYYEESRDMDMPHDAYSSYHLEVSW